MGNRSGLNIKAAGVGAVTGHLTCQEDASGIDLDDRVTLTMQGDLVARIKVPRYNTGMVVGHGSKVAINGKSTIVGGTGGGLPAPSGLHLSVGSEWISDGQLTANGFYAVLIENVSFYQYSYLLLQGTEVGMKISRGTAIVKGKISKYGAESSNIYLEDSSTLKVTGCLEVEGVTLVGNSQLCLVSSEKIVLSRLANSLSIGSTSEGQMQINSVKAAALLMEDAEMFQHQGPLAAEGNSGFALTNSRSTMNGPVMVTATGASGISLSKHRRLTLQDRIDVKAKTSGITIDDSQLQIVGLASITASDQAEVIVSNQGQASFTGARWQSQQLLALTSPHSSALSATQAEFKH